jgi:hypothetical protein
LAFGQQKGSPFRSNGRGRTSIVLTDVEALNINGLRAGNIIFVPVLIAPDKPTMKDMTQVYDLKPVEAEKARKLLSNAQERSVTAPEMNTSYGAEGKVLFRVIDAIPGARFGVGLSTGEISTI